MDDSGYITFILAFLGVFLALLLTWAVENLRTVRDRKKAAAERERGEPAFLR